MKVSMPDQTAKQKLWEAWSYEFSEWIKSLQSAPVELVSSANYSSGYDMDRCHVFKLEDGKYAVIVESGCSCYDVSDAKIELFPKKSQATEKFKKYVAEQEQYKQGCSTR